MVDRQPTAEVFENAVEMAVRAPSVHNTQPWRWRLEERSVDLFADTTRRLPSTDPTGRDLLLSCGAALHHLRLALAVRGWSAEVDYLPNPIDHDHLAHVTMSADSPTRDDIDLSAAILHRRSDRRRYCDRRVPFGRLRQVAERAVPFGAVARVVPPPMRAPLARVARAAASRHANDRAYLAELATWSGRHGTADGVPAANTPRPRHDDIPQRAFREPGLSDSPFENDGSEWLVVGTAADDHRSALRAGEAASALLLTATSLGMASCLQTEPLGMADLRSAIRSDVLLDCAHPQAMVRLGFMPTSAAPLPFTPRRPVDEVIDAGVSA
ncbi:Acg family FMN-binding oxidoreductase [Nocardia amikacinitolerans]|uniref:Acg family FMN-binding oxidoreductase n=1 Tax=Nocardia amikacinitolerans TaxID=756689 RepID=UPI0020A54B1A|nr:nitroreductase family protein [Nocardia amikacinitolerans]MCP2287466.1 Nitroreductase family protein [Nocardia amikacinitolerans]